MKIYQKDNFNFKIVLKIKNEKFSYKRNRCFKI